MTSCIVQGDFDDFSLKINTDGSFSNDTGNARIGGIIRYDRSELITSFYSSINVEATMRQQHMRLDLEKDGVDKMDSVTLFLRWTH